jgi:NAD(P)-dependent dehydrogenase (short-subunit alcohol dehydrogenase family)
VPKPAASLQPASLRADASYLITGGLGTLGLNLAQWLADHGAGHLVLLGRSGVTNPKQKEAIAGIEARGVSVQAIAADVASLDQMSALFARFGRDLPALKGVVHAATANDAGAEGSRVDRLLTMLRPKVSGTGAAR